MTHDITLEDAWFTPRRQMTKPPALRRKVRVPPATCGFCGSTAVTWRKTPAGYVLMQGESFEKHSCHTNAAGFSFTTDGDER